MHHRSDGGPVRALTETTRHEPAVALVTHGQRARRLRGWCAMAIVVSSAGSLTACSADEPPVTARRSVAVAADGEIGSKVSDIGEGADTDRERTQEGDTSEARANELLPLLEFPSDPSSFTVPANPPSPERGTLQMAMVTMRDMPHGWTQVQRSAALRSSGTTSRSLPTDQPIAQGTDADCYVQALAVAAPVVDVEAFADFLGPEGGTWVSFTAGRTGDTLDIAKLQVRLRDCNGTIRPDGATYTIEPYDLPYDRADPLAAWLVQLRIGGVFVSERVVAIVQVDDVIFTAQYFTTTEGDPREVYLLQYGLRLMVGRHVLQVYGP